MTSVFTLAVSNLSPDVMSTLGYTNTETLFYDNSSSECFYVLEDGVLYLISAKSAWLWFGLNGGAVIVYNPFLGRTNLLFSNDSPPLPPPPGFVYLLGDDGAFLKGTDGAFLLGLDDV